MFKTYFSIGLFKKNTVTLAPNFDPKFVSEILWSNVKYLTRNRFKGSVEMFFLSALFFITLELIKN